MRKLLPRTFFNPTSFAGGAIAAVSFGLIFFLFLLESFAGHQKPYVGIIAFVILPAFLLLGLAIAVVGMALERKRRRTAPDDADRFPRIDLNDPHQRSVFGFVSMLTLVLLLSSAFGSYQMYEFTESVRFCGEVCHEVMKPEYTAYLQSPHARVTCAGCHVGSGADWYVRSKLSGAYQVYSVLFNKYSRPIETPVRNLRPAQEICEQCHWPKHFYAEKQVTLNYFLRDEKNTPWSITLLMKTGGGNAETGPTSGIHWHMNIANKITYVAIDSQRQVIPWVRSEHADGTADEYQSIDPVYSEAELARGDRRRMDCIDCHNRPTHIYRSPGESINQVMALGWIDPSLPSVRSIASDALVRSYATERGALDSIALFVREQYESRYPDVAKTRSVAIEAAVGQLRKIYSRNFFPEMQVSWRHYPNNIGHQFDAGCFRCHDGKHATKSGMVISNDCNTCHVILAQGPATPRNVLTVKGVDFQHPADIGTSWKEMKCSDCHTGD